jgi:hypothetical protein
MHGGVDRGCADHSDDGETQRPRTEADDGASSAVASLDSRVVEAVEAYRHPRAALMGTIDSLASRHSNEGTTCRTRA